MNEHTSKRPWLRGALLVTAAILVGWFVGSRMGGDAGVTATPGVTADQVHPDVRGRIIRMAPEDGVMTVDHEAIAGFMPAMVMDLQLAEPRELVGFSPGDDIIFDLVQLAGTVQAVRLRHTDHIADGSAFHNGDAVTADPLGRGDLVPDIELYDASGERFRLPDMEPRHKVVTFFYVRCPLQDYCPTQSARLAQLQQHTAQSQSGVHLVSLTLDAENDGPGVLADYGARFGADPDRWTLAGADDAEAIRKFADRAGARITRDDGPTIDHALIGLRVDGDRIVDVVYGIEAIEALVRAM